MKFVSIKIVKNIFNFFGNILDHHNNVQNENQEGQPPKQYSLTPSLITPKDNKAYKPITDIANMLKEPSIKNIALTGPYGSGKSSVLLTLMHDYPQYNYLNISLATLECNIDQNDEQVSDGEDSSKSNDFQKRQESLNRLIEYSILQQIIYKEKFNSIPQSRFKRIKHISKTRSWAIAIGMILFFLSCCILFEPKLFKIQILYELFGCNHSWKIFWDLLCCCYIFFTLSYAIKELIITTYNSKINKINIKDGEIDIAESTSIFNKHLDEIIYFFEVTNYNIVIIEDLDRFKTSNIFLKLRELNKLLNESKTIQGKRSRRIVFIYAVRDDIFKDTSRTKFFDYIATVIPVINLSNSCDKLLEALNKYDVTGVSEKDCRNLGIFIDDMRILKNIMNEFLQYQSKLDPKLEAKKLLAMIIYKNYYPEDFALLHNGEGIVHRAIKNRRIYINNIISEKNKEIETIQEEIDKILDYYSTQNEKEIRTLYVMKFIELKPNKIIKFIDKNGKRFEPSNIINDKNLFSRLVNNEFINYEYNDTYSGSRTTSLDLKFKDVEVLVNSEYTYNQRIKSNPERLKILEKNIDAIKQEINDLKSLPLKNILILCNGEQFLSHVDGSRLIAYLLQQGYIDEYYYDYISYFYPGTITPSDKDFILDLKIGKKKDYTYKIDKYEAIIEQIPNMAYKNGGILNFSLIDFIAANKEQYPTQWNWILRCVKNRKEYKFINEYYNYSKQPHIFFSDLMLEWVDFFKEAILNQEDEFSMNLHFEILLKYFPFQNFEQFNNKYFKTYLANNFPFIISKVDVIGSENIINLTDLLSVKYTNIEVESINTDIFNVIIENSYYILNYKNVLTIVRYINNDDSEDFYFAAYTTVKQCPNTNFIKNIEDNLGYCLSEVFPQSSMNENEESLIEIVNNSKIASDIRKQYLSSQINKIQDLFFVEGDFWNLAIESNIIEPNWNNIEKYISTDINKPLNQIIINYISKNSSKLSTLKTKDSIEETTDSKLFKELIGSNILSYKDYVKIINSFNRIFKSYDLSSLESNRIAYLIKMDILAFTEENYKILQDSFNTLCANFLLHYKEKYLENIDKYPLTSQIAIEILTSPELSLNEKVVVIERMPVEIITENIKLVNLICSLLDKQKECTIQEHYLLALLKASPDQNIKLSLFIKKCQNMDFNTNFTKSCLQKIGGVYMDIAQQKGLRPKLELSPNNISLVEYLNNNNFISSYQEEKGKLRVNSKNIQ